MCNESLYLWQHNPPFCRIYTLYIVYIMYKYVGDVCVRECLVSYISYFIYVLAGYACSPPGLHPLAIMLEHIRTGVVIGESLSSSLTVHTVIR